jgi:thiosulfate dehydrogenase [quinone] large subunit
MVNIAQNNHAEVRPTGSLAAGAPAAPTWPSPRPAQSDPHATRNSEPTQGAGLLYLLAGIRLALGWVFLWAFLDKLFGLGLATTSAKSWLNGGSPTRGYLGSSVGPFGGFYHAIAGNGFVNVAFMLALLGIGAALMLGIGLRVAAAAGVALTVMMWSAVLPPASNPVMDEHLIYAAVLTVLAVLGAGNTLGLGRMWARTPLVARFTWLK